MPPGAVLIPMVYGAGLATGLVRFQAPALGVVVMLIGAGLLKRHVALSVLASIGALGVLCGWAARSVNQRGCAATLAEGRIVIEAVLLEPVGGGGIAAVDPRQVTCRGELAARFAPAMKAPAGAIVRIEGDWRRDLAGIGRARGLLRASRMEILGSAGSIGTSARNALAAVSARLYGARAPLVDALVVGRRSMMDAELKTAFANSGLVHLLSISGFHIGVLSLWCGFLLRRLGFRRVPALVIAAALGTGYVLFLGWPAPAVRAIALAWSLAWLRWRQRAVIPDALLATTALLVLLLDPWAVVDLGAWLSVLSLWGAVRFARWARQAGGDHWLLQGGASSVGATVATAPLTAMTLGAVAPVGVVLNFVAIPLAASAVPGVLASLFAGMTWPALGSALAAGSGVALHGLELIATWGAAAPFGHFAGHASVTLAAPWVLLLAVLVWATPRQGRGVVAAHRLLLAGVACSWASLAPAAFRYRPSGSEFLALHFLDVGQGDAALIRTPRGHLVLVDAGPADARFDAGRSRVIPAIQREGGGRVDVMLLSHAHADHVGGAGTVLGRIPVSLVIEPAFPVPDPSYRELLGAVAGSGARWKAGRRGERFELDSVAFTLLLPDTTWGGWGLDMNEGSLVVLVEYGGFRALFAGDAGWAAESLLAGRIGRVDLLKVGHHGSRTASGGCFLAELDPAVAVISVGRGNRYGHPSRPTLARLGLEHASVWRTDLEGGIDVTTDGAVMTVRARSRAERFRVPAPPHNPGSLGHHAHCRHDD